eukprot:CAMPEP_0205931434 /NCGR_PEP_ID=MMETSP1325-20131115/27402_1 /ASSEMBLY_ACC=CAM_ASM_000708 /TAXON_ID=236786 /ORGANISM="Florenciella sp., Strain RCC1007" /LENGTH=54 /DNA_ID=CAMNT_0053301005 /DNA_START=34 /DNA_END=194 /DNA_ORIENTATION=+
MQHQDTKHSPSSRCSGTSSSRSARRKPYDPGGGGGAGGATEGGTGMLCLSFSSA